MHTYKDFLTKMLYVEPEIQIILSVLLVHFFLVELLVIRPVEALSRYMTKGRAFMKYAIELEIIKYKKALGVQVDKECAEF